LGSKDGYKKRTSFNISKLQKFSTYCKNNEKSIDTITEDKILCEDGDIVKSKSEMVIDNFFFRNNIRHIYEKKILGMLCDWYLIDYDIYVEFIGLQNEEYILKNNKKIKKYNRNGLKVIQIYNYNLRDLNSILEILNKIRRKIYEDR
jgi:hypothetical protein